MTERKQVVAQLRKLGITMKGWGAPELNELPTILLPHETIMSVVQGWYDNGFATLVATDRRLLLIDKKWLQLTIEDIRYDMVVEVDFKARLVDASIMVNTINKSLTFSSMRTKRLRELTHYVQERVMELRTHDFSWRQFEQTPVSSPTTQTLMPTPMPMATSAGIPSATTMVSPLQATTQMVRSIPQNHFAKISMTTKHNFLPKVPRRFRPDSS